MEKFNSIVNKSLGYQISHNMFDTVSLNNAGDPFSKTNFYKANTHEEERQLINYYGKGILKLDKFWGYCATGSTEGIMNGLWMARKRFPSNTPIYASRDSHFCVAKIADMLCMPIVSIPVLENTGSMDMNILREKIQESKRNQHAIVVLTMGSTIRNGYDNMDDFYNIVTNTLPDVTFHIHVDGAFGGAIYPFVKPEWLEYKFDTFNMSFHKYLGCPFPCALFITTKSVQNEIIGMGCFGKEMVCLPNKDFTVSCSRNGIAVSLITSSVCKDGFVELNKQNIQACMEKKKNFLEQCVNKNIEHRWINDMSLSVELLNIPMEKETELAPYGVSIRKNGKNTFDTHVYICNHVSQELLLEVINILA